MTFCAPSTASPGVGFPVRVSAAPSLSAVVWPLLATPPPRRAISTAEAVDEEVSADAGAAADIVTAIPANAVTAERLIVLTDAFSSRTVAAGRSRVNPAFQLK